jgi:hypothetical protein
MVKLNHIFKYKHAIKVLTLMLVLCFGKSLGQVLVTTTSYFQDFGSIDVTAWTDNSTYLGWYATDIGGTLHQNITSALPTNTGAFYTYECNGNNDQKIGTRASGGTGTIQYGVLLRNQTGMPFVSMRVTYKGSQLSLSQNGSNINTIAFSIATSAAPLTLVSGGYINVPTLNFVQLQNSTVNGSNQINSYICTQETNITSCIITNIPNNNYFMLRWTDVDDGGNDHHMAIDNVQVDFGLVTNDCLRILPINLLDFYATQNGSINELTWKVTSEKNVFQYVIEKSEDGENFVELTKLKSTGSEGSYLSYLCEDNSPYEGVTYYRLSTQEYDGKINQYKIIDVDRTNKDWSPITYQHNSNLILEFKNSVPKNSVVNLFDLSGKLLVEETIEESQTIINTQRFAEGIYFLRISTPYKTQNHKLIIQK